MNMIAISKSIDDAISDPILASTESLVLLVARTLELQVLNEQQRVAVLHRELDRVDVLS